MQAGPGRRIGAHPVYFLMFHLSVYLSIFRIKSTLAISFEPLFRTYFYIAFLFPAPPEGRGQAGHAEKEK